MFLMKKIDVRLIFLQIKVNGLIIDVLRAIIVLVGSIPAYLRAIIAFDWAIIRFKGEIIFSNSKILRKLCSLIMKRE